MRRLTTLLAAALLVGACGRTEPPAAGGAATPAPAATTVPATVATTTPSAAAAPAADTPAPLTPSPAPATHAAVTAEAQTSAALTAQAATPGAAEAGSTPPSAFDRLRYLLPADLTGYIFPNPERAYANDAAFGVGLIPPWSEPSPRTTIVLAGGAAAFAEWHLQRIADSGATPLRVRGVVGSVRDDGLAYYLLWEEDGNIYTVMAPSGSLDELAAFAEGLAAYDPATWRALLSPAPPTPAPDPPTRTPLALPTTGATGAQTATVAAFPAGALRYLTPYNVQYEVVADERIYADERGFFLVITPQGEEPGPFTTITIAGGEAAATTWANNQPTDEPGALIEPLPVRGGAGTFTSSGLGATVAWVEDGHPYYVSHPGPDDVEILTFVERLWVQDLAAWRAAIAAAPTR